MVILVPQTISKCWLLKGATAFVSLHLIECLLSDEPTHFYMLFI